MKDIAQRMANIVITTMSSTRVKAWFLLFFNFFIRKFLKYILFLFYPFLGNVKKIIFKKILEEKNNSVSL